MIPNFLDCHVYRRRRAAGLRARYCRGTTRSCVLHVSNFRPVKRVDAVVEVFARIAARVPARLLLVGDGPDSSRRATWPRRSTSSTDVECLGEQDQVVPLLSIADLFLLPSARRASVWRRSRRWPATCRSSRRASAG